MPRSITPLIAVALALVHAADVAAQQVRQPGYVGMTVDAVDREGLRIVEVTRGGPADRGGVREGDLLLAVDGKPMNDVKDLIEILRTKTVGAKLDVLVGRLGRRLQVNITLGKPPVSASGPPMLGLRTLPVTAELREQYRLPLARGAFVTAVTKDSPADKAGIPRHALIAKINGRNVATPEDLLRWVKHAGPGGDVELIYYDQGRLRKTSLKLADTNNTRDIAPKPNPPPKIRPDNQREPARPDRPPLPTSDRQRIRLLEQRIEELERRIRELEGRHEKNT